MKNISGGAWGCLPTNPTPRQLFVFPVPKQNLKTPANTVYCSIFESHAANVSYVAVKLKMVVVRWGPPKVKHTHTHTHTLCGHFCPVGKSLLFLCPCKLVCEAENLFSNKTWKAKCLACQMWWMGRVRLEWGLLGKISDFCPKTYPGPDQIPDCPHVVVCFTALGDARIHSFAIHCCFLLRNKKATEQENTLFCTVLKHSQNLTKFGSFGRKTAEFWKRTQKI